MLLSASDCLIHGEEYEECDDQEEIELDVWTFAAILIIFYCCRGRMKKSSPVSETILEKDYPSHLPHSLVIVTYDHSK